MGSDHGRGWEEKPAARAAGGQGWWRWRCVPGDTERKGERRYVSAERSAGGGSARLSRGCRFS